MDQLKAFARAATLADAIRIGLAQRPPWQVIDVIAQDEYTHDVIFMPDGGEGRAIVLDCT